MSAVEAGVPHSPDTEFSVTPRSAWTKLPKALNPTQGAALTQDGMSLGVVYLATVRNDKFFADRPKQGIVPRHTAGATPIEQVDFLVTSLEQLGFTGVEASNVRPDRLDGQSATRLDLGGLYPNGLVMRGDAALVPGASGLNLMVFLAPALHYYDRYREDVDALFASADFQSADF